MIENTIQLVEGIHEFDADDFGTTQSLVELLNQRADFVAALVTCSELQVHHTMPKVVSGQFLPVDNLGGTVMSYGKNNPQLNTSVLGTIAYYVERYNLRHLVVCGHLDCQIVRFVLNKHRADDPETSTLYFQLGEPARGIIDQFYGVLSKERLRPIIMQEHVLLQIESLLSNPSLKTLFADKELKFHGWVVDDETNTVYAYDAAEHSFAAIG